MLQSTFKEGLRPAWFVADEVYSRDGSFWYWLEQTFQQPYVLTVTKKQPTPINFQTHYAEDLLEKLKEKDWQTRTWRKTRVGVTRRNLKKECDYLNHFWA